ncbi:MAG: SH3 domain-containing protein, partial [Thermodesulfobacteriota bacterium]
PYSNKKDAETETISEPQSDRRIVALTVSSANLRRGPDKKYPVTSVAKSSDVIQKVDERGSWIKVKTQSGAEGWIWKKLVREEIE